MTTVTAEDEYIELVRTELLRVRTFAMMMEKSLAVIYSLSEEHHGKDEREAVQIHTDDSGIDRVGGESGV